MKRYLPTVVCLALCLAMLSETAAQQQPSIGYIYPSGGQRGSVVNVMVGGQYLNGVNKVYWFGEGVQAQVIKHIKPMPRKVLNELNQKLRELNRRKQSGQINGAKLNSEFVKFAKSKGVPEMDLKTFNILRLKLKDPKRQPNTQLAEQVVLRITISEHAKRGNRELRLGTPVGLTNPLIFQVGQYPECNEVEPNDDLSNAQDIKTMPVVVNGQVLPGDRDAFRFKARQGQRLVASVQARRLIPYMADAVPGWFQATLTLYDADGNEVAFTDDFGFHPDPVLGYQIPADGEYVLVIHDAIFRGREDFVYRITLGEIPFVISMFPLGGRSGLSTTVQLSGWNLPEDTLEVNARGKRAGMLSVSTHRGKWESNFAAFEVDTLKEINEDEPNDQPVQSQPIDLQRIINGRIDKRGDQDAYNFTGSKGQRVAMEIRARRLGSELDSVIELTDSDGKLLESNDDFEDKGAGLITHQADSRISATLPRDGTYFVYVRDMQGHGGPEYGYRLRVSTPERDFALRVVPSSINTRPGMTVPLTVYAMRKDGFNRRIDLKLVDMPGGFSLSGGWIPAGQDKITVSLTVPKTALAEAIPLRLEGQVSFGRRKLRHQAVPAEDMMQAFLYRHLVPMRGALVSVQGRERRGQLVELLSPVPVKLPMGGTATVRLATPKGPFIDQLELEVREPPEGVSVEKIKPEDRGVAVTVATSGDGIKRGQQGNLIIEAFSNRTWKDKDGKKRSRRISLGILPAVPFEVVTSRGRR